MKFSLAAALLGCLSAVSALPLPQSPQQLSAVSALPLPQTPQQPIDDVAILQFALSLENLEANFYFQGLNQFSEADFRRENIPNPTQTFQHLHHILQHEVQHVKTLRAVITSLGGTPVPPCEYQFPFQTVQQFMDVANSLEKVGVSAYNGAVALLQNGDLQTAAATIDTVEGRHASFLQTANGGDPFPENFDVALDGRQIITLASPFIKQCSFDLGFVPFGTLQIKNQIHLPESDVECAFQEVSAGGQNFCNWLFADQSVVVPLNGNRCKAPPGARGDVYLMITNDQTPVSLKKTGSIVAGPAIVTIDTAHTDSCKELFSGKQLKEGQLNQPIDKGPIPMHDPTFNNAGALPLLPPAAAFPPPAYDAVPGVPPSNFDAILSPASSVPPPAYDAVPGVPPSNFDAILSPTSSVLPPAYDAVPGVPPSSFDAIPPSASSVPPPTYGAAPDVPPPPPVASDVPIEVRLEDPAIASMLAEIQALSQPQPIPPSELPVDPSIPPTNIESGQLPGGEPVYGEAPPPTETAAPPPADPSAVPPEDDPSAIPPEDDPSAIPADDVEANLSATETPPTEDEPVISFENNLTADTGPEPATDEEFPVFNL